ncbi:hypothetical protein MOOR_17870 [Moorella thermoacetica]|uniref:Uncharacterized protein n=1 Tax=Neomoorella thermoacetica TaxID=1525 RepID=A0A1J5JVN3_NEOTH|nr:hypothetical protein MOOR_17870 [Moorella thermoacetica]
MLLLLVAMLLKTSSGCSEEPVDVRRLDVCQPRGQEAVGVGAQKLVLMEIPWTGADIRGKIRDNNLRTAT